METETQRGEKETARTTDPQVCPSCNAALVDGMRFCRMCGYRLGEGMAEYVETIRFDAMPDMIPGMAQGNQTLTNAPGAPTTMITPMAAPLAPMWKPRRGKKVWSALIVVMALFLATVVGGKFLFRVIRDAAQQSISRFQPPPEPPRSFFGASEFGDTEGTGALLEQPLPGGPAERAGLVDGDIITKVDGTSITGEDALRDVVRQTPIGKTVEVVYLRDGETKSTMLTTISNRDYDSDAFRPKERGLLGVDDLDRVPVEGTKIHGVRLGDVYDNRPGDLAGLKEGDIVVEFDGKPVRTPEGLSGYINLAKPASTIPIVVYREGQRIVIPVKMGRRN
jgi:membrane-associated protease RseP (regulator of RpoE activity)